MKVTSHMSSVSGPYSAIDPYVKPFFPPDPPQMTALKFHPKHEKRKQIKKR